MLFFSSESLDDFIDTNKIRKSGADIIRPKMLENFTDPRVVIFLVKCHPF